MIKESIVHTVTSDNIEHYGLSIEPENQYAATVLWVHGLNQSFYLEPALSIGREIASNGIMFISGNNRGHDFGTLLTRKNDGPILGGGGWEKLTDSYIDLDAWINYIAENLGVTNHVYILGHSLGTRKAVYYLHRVPSLYIKGLILLSPSTTYKEADPVIYQQALEMVTRGDGMDLIPWPEEGFGMSAQTYLEKFDPREIMLNLFSGSDRPPVSDIAVPMLVITSSEENENANKMSEINIIRDRATGCPNFQSILIPDTNCQAPLFSRPLSESCLA